MIGLLVKRDGSHRFDEPCKTRPARSPSQAAARDRARFPAPRRAAALASSRRPDPTRPLRTPTHPTPTHDRESATTLLFHATASRPEGKERGAPGPTSPRPRDTGRRRPGGFVASTCSSQPPSHSPRGFGFGFASLPLRCAALLPSLPRPLPPAPPSSAARLLRASLLASFSSLRGPRRRAGRDSSGGLRPARARASRGRAAERRRRRRRRQR